MNLGKPVWNNNRNREYTISEAIENEFPHPLQKIEILNQISESKSEKNQISHLHIKRIVA